MSAQNIETPDPNHSLLQIALDAEARGRHLIHNGREIVTSTHVPPGWWRVAIHVKDAPPEQAA